MGLIYNNRLIINQRGGSIDIDNGTEREKVKISQRSGSNIALTNVVNSELATTNKQVNVINDSFETVGGDKTTFVGKTHTLRTGESSYELKGFVDQSQLNAFQTWKDTYSPIAQLNGEFKIKRGTLGSRAANPVIGSSVVGVDNIYNGYQGTPVRTSSQDDVSIYLNVPDRGKTKPAKEKYITQRDIEDAGGAQYGSSAPGVLEFGASKSAATEGGTWAPNVSAQNIEDIILGAQDILTSIEQSMGHGGDDTKFLKRNSYGQIGTVFNDYPALRIDPKGRSQPFEMIVGNTGAFKNHDYIPHAEEVDNSSNFPGGNDDKIICNRYSRIVGSGGIQLKTTGNMELGGASLKAGFNKININAAHGVQIASEASVEIQSLKTITLRTNRQVFVESAMGVKNNLVVGGGIYAEGEVYCHHITAPLEVQQTHDTTVFGKFATDEDRALVIGEVFIPIPGIEWQPVYAKASDNLILNYPHSHHFNNLPLRLTKANADVRDFCQLEGINKHTQITQPLAQNHEKKEAQVAKPA